MNAFALIMSGLAGLLAGGLATAFFMRAGLQRCRAAHAAEVRTGGLLLEERQRQTRELLGRLEQMTGELETLRERVRLETEKRATAEEKCSRIPALEEIVRRRREELAGLGAGHTALTARVAELETRLLDERQNSREKLALLNETKEQLKQEFHNVANRIFEDKSEKFTEKNRSNLDTLLSPLREQLQSFKKRIEEVYDNESRDRVSLLAEIGHLKQLNQQIGEEAVNLTHALKGQAKVQGGWGEVILERILEESGLHKGREYEAQGGYDNAAGGRRHPDVIVHLPEGRDVVVDSKVSLTAYEKYCSAATDETREKRLREHLLSLRGHIRNLGAKRYENLEGLRSLDFVLLFLPIEGAFWIAIEREPALFNEAFEKNIMLVGPSTLLATLRIIQNIWRHEDRNRNAQLIAKKAGDLFDKFAGFVHSLEDVGDKLDKARGAYETAHRQLTSGKGNLIRRTEELKQLGVKSKKDLPRLLLDEVSADEEENSANG